MLRGTICQLNHYLLRSKIFRSYRYNARNSEEEEERDAEKIKNIKYKLKNLMQVQYKKSISEIYIRIEQETKKELKRIQDIYGNILESIHGAAKKARITRRKNNKLW